MKKITQSFLFVLCLAVLLFTGNTAVLKAQTPAESNISFNEIAAKMIRSKKSAQPFVLITPADLLKLSSAERESIINGGPCETATPININQTVNGQLTSSDCLLEDNSYADFYTFNGSSGQNITLTMSSSAVDTYLGLANITGTFVIEDDDGGGGTNSRINATLPETGMYIILANTALPNQFGNYTLSLTGAVTCTYSLNPTSATIPAEGGTFSFTINAPAGCQWSASVAGASFITTNSSGNGTGTVTYTAAPNGFTGTRTETITVAGQTFTVTQPPLNCTFSINPTSATAPAVGGEASFTITTLPGCYWSATPNNFFVSTNSTGTGSGTVNYMVTPNNGTNRTGTITVGGQVFTITQPGLNCTFSVSPTSISVDRSEHFGVINVTTQPGCYWSAVRGDFWIELNSSAGSGSGTISYRIYQNIGTVSRSSQIVVFGMENIRVNVTQTGFSLPKTRMDFDGDGKADVSVFRPENGSWYIQQSNAGFTGLAFGLGTDKLAPADFDGDGKTDVAVVRNGTWYLQRSQAGFTGIAFGDGNDVPVPADFDGDGKAEIAVFRPSNGYWYILNLVNNQFTATLFGINGDKPVAADYDGDGKADIAVNRSGNWYIQRSQLGFTGITFGDANDKLVPADYDGDGKADVAVFRPSNGSWYIQQSQAGFTGTAFGLGTDIPVAADYDGDGRADIAVVRNGNWYLNRTTQGFTGTAFGTSTDLPIPNAFVK